MEANSGLSSPAFEPNIGTVKCASGAPGLGVSAKVQVALVSKRCGSEWILSEKGMRQCLLSVSARTWGHQMSFRVVLRVTLVLAPLK
eukprot:COSAG05_NODE_6438_length_958_cov_0.718277_2_plen_87_part_00